MHIRIAIKHKRWGKLISIMQNDDLTYSTEMLMLIHQRTPKLSISNPLFDAPTCNQRRPQSNDQVLVQKLLCSALYVRILSAGTREHYSISASFLVGPKYTTENFLLTIIFCVIVLILVMYSELSLLWHQDVIVALQQRQEITHIIRNHDETDTLKRDMIL